MVKSKKDMWIYSGKSILGIGGMISSGVLVHSSIDRFFSSTPRFFVLKAGMTVFCTSVGLFSGVTCFMYSSKNMVDLIGNENFK